MKFLPAILISIIFLTTLCKNEVEGCLELAVSKNVFIGGSEYRIFCTNVKESSPIGTIACEFIASHAQNIQIVDVGNSNITQYIKLNQVGGSDRLVQLVIAKPITDILDTEKPKSSLEGQFNCQTTTGFSRENKFTLVLQEENNHIPEFAKYEYIININENTKVGEDISMKDDSEGIIATDNDNGPYTTSSNIIQFTLKNYNDIFQVKAIQRNHGVYPISYRAEITLKRSLTTSENSEYALTLEAWNLDPSEKSIALVTVHVVKAKEVSTISTSTSTEHDLHSESSGSPVTRDNEIDRINQSSTSTEATTTNAEFEFSGDGDGTEGSGSGDEMFNRVDYDEFGMIKNDDDEAISGDWVRHYDFYQ